jgi:hypothetical protein
MKILILHVAIILLFTVHTLKVCGQQQARVNVQQELKQLSEASLCGSSTPPPQPAPAVVQKCHCSPPVNWTSVTITSIGSSNVRQTGTLAYDIPSVIPNSAKEILVFASVNVGNSGPDQLHFVKIYTRQAQQQYEKYITLHTFSQNAFSTNSDNLWFPMTSGRQVFLELTYAHTGSVTVSLYAIGYR